MSDRPSALAPVRTEGAHGVAGLGYQAANAGEVGAVLRAERLLIAGPENRADSIDHIDVGKLANAYFEAHQQRIRRRGVGVGIAAEAAAQDARAANRRTLSRRGLSSRPRVGAGWEPATGI